MDQTRPPLGSWPRTYWLACVLAAIAIFLLWVLTHTFNMPRAGA